MNCAEAKQQLNFLPDKEIDEFQKDEIARHLKNCPSCQNDLEQLQMTSELLKKHLPVSAPVQLDARVLNAFQNYHANKKLPAITNKKRGLFGRILVPVPLFALLLAVFAIAVGAAYQFGKISAAKVNSSVTESNKSSPEKSPETVQTAQIPLIKYVEVPVTKIVKVPVFKEKTITKFIEKNKDIEKSNAPENSRADATAAANTNNQYLTRFSLEGFQSVSELKPKIIKKEKN